jgi:hypothetical protein
MSNSSDKHPLNFTISKLADLVEAIFRYLLPGVVFLVLLYLSISPSGCVPKWITNISELLKSPPIILTPIFSFIILFTFVLSIGMSIYALHKVLWSTINYYVLGRFVLSDYANIQYSNHNNWIIRKLINVGKLLIYPWGKNEADCLKWARLAISRKLNWPKEFNSNTNYKWAFIHNSLMTCEILLLFCLFAKPGSFVKHHLNVLMTTSLTFFILSLLVYIWSWRSQSYYTLDRDLDKNLKEAYTKQENMGAS